MNEIYEDGILKFIIEEDLIAPNVKTMNIDLMEVLDRLDSVEEIIIDLNSIQNIDSVGVSFVVSLYKNISNEGLEFRVINASKDIIQLFKLMRLDEFFMIEE